MPVWIAQYALVRQGQRFGQASSQPVTRFSPAVGSGAAWPFFSSLGFERAAALVRYGRGLLIGLLALFGVVTSEAAPAALVGASALLTILYALREGSLGGVHQ